MKKNKEITAFRLVPDAALVKGDPARDWMDLSNQRFAYGCLPLIIANELGWDIICLSSFRAIWNGGITRDSIVIEFSDPNNFNNNNVASHFGEGVITFEPGFLFQTTDEHNLYVKGVPNSFKDGIHPLEGLVETDWLPLTFTMNWKFTRPDVWVNFNKGEPIGRVLPYPRNYIESFNPIIKYLDKETDFSKEVKVWGNDREKLIQAMENGEQVGLEKNYFKGIDKNDNKIDRHQKKIVLDDFTMVGAQNKSDISFNE